jgi:regulator of cell morphogenesis and NO signaling
MGTATQSIREIISSQPTAAAILQRFDIDVCAHANDSLREACADQQLSVEQVLEKLEDGAATEAGGEQIDPANLAPSRLIQHIVRIHHRNVRQELPRLVELARLVAERHGERAPELKRIQGLTEELRAELTEHIRKEEQVLFPYIAQLDDSPLIGFRPPQACFSRVGQPVFMMAQEHEQAKLLVGKLRELTNDLKPPVWACSALVAFYSGLRTFAGKLDEHIRLENEVLFPRAIEMESELMGEGAR